MMVSFTDKAAMVLRAAAGGGGGFCAYIYFCIQLSGLFPDLRQIHERHFTRPPPHPTPYDTNVGVLLPLSR